MQVPEFDVDVEGTAGGSCVKLSGTTLLSEGIVVAGT